MNVLSALYDSYRQAEANNLIDRYDLNVRDIVILPLFHSNRKSDGNNVLELRIDREGNPLSASFIEQDHYITFPVTEESSIRTVNIAPHSLCDELTYLSQSIDPRKYEAYKETLLKWYDFSQNDEPQMILTAVNKLLTKGDLLDLSIEALQKSHNLSREGSIVELETEAAKEGKAAKTKRIDFAKVFLTFAVESGQADVPTAFSSTSIALHESYIRYIRASYSSKEAHFNHCDLSGEWTYCTEKHRGLMGTAKVISTSHKETHYGRFKNGNEVIRIGYEASERIHLMLKFFLDHPDNRVYLGENTNALIWFSDDLFNERNLDINNPTEIFEFGEDFSIDDMEDSPESRESLNDEVAAGIGKSMIGLKNPLNPAGTFYILILNKISNGRLALQYFRALRNSQLADNMARWYDSTYWPRFDREKGAVVDRSPYLFDIIRGVFGEESDGRLTARNSKLSTLTYKNLIPCIVDGRPLPREYAHRMFLNFKKRSSYTSSWLSILYLTCALNKKSRLDRQLGRETEMLDPERQTRSYLHGRLIAIFEKLENDAMSANYSGNDKKTFHRETNAEKMWSAYMAAPERTLGILKQKIEPYQMKLKANRPGSFIYYNALIADILGDIRESETYDKEKNKALNDDVVFGYYAQNKALWSKRTTDAD